jgi:hypothetical protein
VAYGVLVSSGGGGGGGGAWEVIGSQTVTGSGIYSMEFTGIDTTYKSHIAVIDMNTGSDSVSETMYFKVGDAAGYLTGSTDYKRARNYINHSGSESNYGGNTYNGQVMTVSGSRVFSTLDLLGLGTSGGFISKGLAIATRYTNNETYTEFNSTFAKNTGAKTLDRIKFFQDWDGGLAIGIGSTVTLYGIKTS